MKITNWKNSINLKPLKKFYIVLLLSLFLNNCATTKAEGSCSGIVESVQVVANCAMTGGFLQKLAAKWDDDFKLHKSHFVEHLINAPDKPTITNWYNPKTKNSGNIKTSTFYKGSVKCRDWESVIDITPSWPFTRFGVIMGSPVRRSNVGTACIMPDGRVMLKEF